MLLKKLTSLSLALAILSGCSTTGDVSGEGGDDNRADPGSRYSLKNDIPPERDIDVGNIPDATPTAEPYTKRGNKTPYQVWGKTYHVMESHKGYKETGMASWYGQKFHGHETSNGEIYDMYEMTAAHKSLPVPSYVNVKNLDNGREVVVRVNDRGPFHSDRIVDLSYAAAKKLDYKDKGTARVQLTAITVNDSTANAIAGSRNDEVIESTPLENVQYGSIQEGDFFVQVGAFSEEDRAKNFRKDVQDRLSMGMVIQSEGQGLLARHKVMVGPFKSRSSAETNLDTIKRSGFFGSFIK